ncbi:MAG TPA: tRNA-uridine aminocarboxypropyltransferase [Polyangiaceae bacterium]|nr:tRNA-uridine aminocarboxypropyltransferase [Polyangiaceae bacterium]
MGHRAKNGVRCPRCRLHAASCVCEHLSPLQLETRLVLVMHYKELPKTTATGPLALAALGNSQLYVHGLRDQPLSLDHLHDEARRVLLLYPQRGALPLNEAFRGADPRPLTLVVPDGSWGQASRIPKRIGALARAQPVTLPPGPASRWQVRRETQPEGLSTFEAIARALGYLESNAVQLELESWFERMLTATYQNRGHERGTPGWLVHGHPPPRSTCLE